MPRGLRSLGTFHANRRVHSDVGSLNIGNWGARSDANIGEANLFLSGGLYSIGRTTSMKRRAGLRDSNAEYKRGGGTVEVRRTAPSMATVMRPEHQSVGTISKPGGIHHRRIDGTQRHGRCSSRAGDEPITGGDTLKSAATAIVGAGMGRGVTSSILAAAQSKSSAAT